MSFNEETDDVVLENKTVTQDHRLEVDGTTFREKKVVSTYCAEGSDTPLKTEKIHARWIGGRVYTVTEIEMGQAGFLFVHFLGGI